MVNSNRNTGSDNVIVVSSAAHVSVVDSSMQRSASKLLSRFVIFLYIAIVLYVVY